MNNETAMDLSIDISSDLASTGDIKQVKGSAAVLLEAGFELAFLPGEGIAWSLEMRRIAGAVEVSGTVSGSITLTCYRCLNGFEFPLGIRLREHALWLDEGDVEPGDECTDEYAVTCGGLDIMPMLRDAICLALPSKRVCREGCKGLCPSCGADLNIGQCDCDTGKVDTRLKPLADLKKRLEENRG